MRGIIFILITVLLSINTRAFPLEQAPKNKEKDKSDPQYYEPYLQLLDEVYDRMDKHYYKPVSRSTYENFVEKYKNSVLSKLTVTDSRIDMVAYRGAGLLVNHLKDPEDTFTNFIPPKKAEEYARQVYGYENDIGITGHLTDQGYIIDHVQIRSDSYLKGIKTGDVIMKIDGDEVTQLNQEEIKDLLHPPLETIVKLEIFSPEKKLVSSYEVACTEYFKETITSINTGIPGVHCLKIHSFNRKTGEDLKDWIKTLKKEKMDLLIIDLRDNPGGPPLAVHEISGIFFPPRQKLFYYKKKNTKEFGLIAPSSEITYEGPLIMLINKKSGSASELFVGTLKAYKRALVFGKEPTAGRAFLKSTFKFEDESMLAMVTGIAYLFNGEKFGMEGVSPNYVVPAENEDILKFVLDKYKEGELYPLFTPEK